MERLASALGGRVEHVLSEAPLRLRTPTPQPSSTGRMLCSSEVQAWLQGLGAQQVMLSDGDFLVRIVADLVKEQQRVREPI